MKATSAATGQRKTSVPKVCWCRVAQASRRGGVRRFVLRDGAGVVGVGRRVTVGRKAAWCARTPWKLVRWALGGMRATRRPTKAVAVRTKALRGGAGGVLAPGAYSYRPSSGRRSLDSATAPCCRTCRVSRGLVCHGRARRCRRGGRSPSPPRHAGAWATEAAPAPAVPAGRRAGRPRTRLASTGPKMSAKSLLAPRSTRPRIDSTSAVVGGGQRTTPPSFVQSASLSGRGVQVKRALDGVVRASTR